MVFDHPLESVRKLVTEVGSTPEPEWECLVKVVMALPGHPKEFPIIWVHRDNPESRFYVCFCHVTP